MLRHNRGKLILNADKRNAVWVSTTSSPRSSSSCADGATRKCRCARLKQTGRRGRSHRCGGPHNPDLRPFFIAEASVSQSSSHYLRQNSQIYFHVECRNMQVDVPLDTRCLEAICVGTLSSFHTSTPGTSHHREYSISGMFVILNKLIASRHRFAQSANDVRRTWEARGTPIQYSRDHKYSAPRLRSGVWMARTRGGLYFSRSAQDNAVSSMATTTDATAGNDRAREMRASASSGSMKGTGTRVACVPLS